MNQSAGTGPDPQQINALIALYKQGRAQELVARGRDLAARYPAVPLIPSLMGAAYAQLGQHDETVASFNRALELAPDDAVTHYNFATALMRLGDYESAASRFRRALDIRPDYAEAYLNLGIMLRNTNRIREAEAYFRKAHQLRPDSAEAWFGLGLALRERLDLAGSIEAMKQALVCAPHHTLVHSNLLFVLSYNVLTTPAELLAESVRWDRVHGAAGRAKMFHHRPSAAHDRRLRIGYVSPDFLRHAVSYFFEPVLLGHDRDRFEICCYAEVAQPDDVTKRLQQASDLWRSTVGMSNEQVAQRIHDDGIDILVDLAGHTSGNNRLQAFTYKPAPVQASYLGYCATTGLAAMDYWITDEVLTPADTVERSSEEIWRLDRCWLCYRPDPQAPAVSMRPDTAPVTFGSFNQLSKLTDDVVRVWAGILSAVPESKLLLKTKNLGDPAIRAEVSQRFARVGIDDDRLIYRGHTTDYLAQYGEVDIALDPFPRTGGATTADALWMGVPVITLAGERMIERQGVSMLTAVGLEELVAQNAEEYTARAVTLAQDKQYRQELRQTLRSRMQASPLCDSQGLAGSLERAYAAMWSRWSASRPPRDD